jgi:hypothetical protein
MTSEKIAVSRQGRAPATESRPLNAPWRVSRFGILRYLSMGLIESAVSLGADSIRCVERGNRRNVRWHNPSLRAIGVSRRATRHSGQPGSPSASADSRPTS